MTENDQEQQPAAEDSGGRKQRRHLLLSLLSPAAVTLLLCCLLSPFPLSAGPLSAKSVIRSQEPGVVHWDTVTGELAEAQRSVGWTYSSDL